MKKQILLFLSMIFLSLSAHSSLNKEQVIDAIKGKYKLQTNFTGDIQFLIRSSGKLQVIKSDWFDGTSSENFPATMTFTQGDNGMLMGLPVFHLTFSEGSDEQAVDYHLLITATQGWGNEEITVKLLSSFALENDGPNELASVFDTKLTLLKYNKETKRYRIVK